MLTDYVDYYRETPEEAIRISNVLAEGFMKRARQYRDHDMPWLRSHDPEEYEKQLELNPVKREVDRARFYSRVAQAIAREERNRPKQRPLF